MAGGNDVAETKVPAPTPKPTPTPVPERNKAINPAAGAPGGSNTGTGGIGASGHASGNGTSQTVPDEKSATQQAMCNPDGSIKDIPIPCSPDTQKPASEQNLGSTLGDGVTTGFSNTPKNNSGSVLPGWVTDKKIDTTEPDTKQQSDSKPAANTDKTKPSSRYASKTIDAVREGYKPNSPTNNTGNTAPITKRNSGMVESSGDKTRNDSKDGVHRSAASKNGSYRIVTVGNGEKEGSGTQPKDGKTGSDNTNQGRSVESTEKSDPSDISVDLLESVEARYTPDRQGVEDQRRLREGPAERPEEPSRKITGKRDLNRGGSFTAPVTVTVPKDNASEEELIEFRRAISNSPSLLQEYEKWLKGQQEYDSNLQRCWHNRNAYVEARKRFERASTLSDTDLETLESDGNVTIDDEQREYLTSFLKAATDGASCTDGEEIGIDSSISNLDEFIENNPQLKSNIGNSIYLVSSEQIITSEGKPGSKHNIPIGIRKLLWPPTSNDDCSITPKEYNNKLVDQYHSVASILDATDQRYRNGSDIDGQLVQSAAGLAGALQKMRDAPQSPFDKNPRENNRDRADETLNLMLRAGGVDRRAVARVFADDTAGKDVIQPLMNYDWQGKDTQLNLGEHISLNPNLENNEVIQQILRDNPSLKNSPVANENYGINIVLSQLGARPTDPITQRAVNNLVHKSGDRTNWVRNPGVMQTVAETMRPYWADLAGQEDYPHLDKFETQREYADFTATLFSDPLAASTVTNGFRAHQRNIATTYGRTNGVKGDGQVVGVMLGVLEKSAQKALDNDTNRRTYIAAQTLSNKALAYDVTSNTILAGVSAVPGVGPVAAIGGFAANPLIKDTLVGSGQYISPDATKEDIIKAIERDHTPTAGSVEIAQGYAQRLNPPPTDKDKNWETLNDPENSPEDRELAATAWLKSQKITWTPSTSVNGTPKKFEEMRDTGYKTPGINPSPGLQ